MKFQVTMEEAVQAQVPYYLRTRQDVQDALDDPQLKGVYQVRALEHFEVPIAMNPGEQSPEEDLQHAADLFWGVHENSVMAPFTQQRSLENQVDIREALKEAFFQHMCSDYRCDDTKQQPQQPGGSGWRQTPRIGLDTIMFAVTRL